MVLVPVQKSSISDAVFEQLRSEIVQGRIAANADLPSERELSQTLQVNRHAVREAVRRLEQAGLVQSQHGTGNKVLDFRQHAGLSLLPDLLVTADGDINTAMVRSVLELRHALAPAVAPRVRPTRWTGAGGPDLWTGCRTRSRR
jgi:GntR family transcriptional repressor for pyruvate dehydrogenase complex